MMLILIGQHNLLSASSFENAGQMCTSTERIYVDERIADSFEQRTAEIASQYQIGPWNQERCQYRSDNQ